MRRTLNTLLVPAVLALAVLASGARPALATMDLQKKAKAAGFEGSTNCLYCHNEKLPKKGATTHNARGTFLDEEKKKRGLKQVDVNWLKDYVEPK